MKNYLTFKNLIIVLVILRLVVFGSFFITYGVDKLREYTDSNHYWGLAKSIHDDWSFKNNEIVISPQAETFGQPNAFRVPGYPLFLSVFWNLGESGYIAVPVAQFLLGLISVYLLYLLAKQIFSEKVAQIAAAILLLEPTFLTLNFLILSDTLFIVFLLLFIYQGILFLQTSKTKYLILTSLFLAIAILIRPVALYLPIVFLIVLLYYFRHLVVTFFYKAMIFLILVIIFLSPWYIRNYLVFNQVFLTTLPAYNNWCYNVSFWSMKMNFTNYRQTAQQECIGGAGKENKELMDFAVPKNLIYFNQKTKEFLKDNFWLAVKNQAFRMFLQTIDGRYFNHFIQLYTGRYYDKGYSQFFSSDNKWQFIKNSPELLISSLLVFLIFLNTLAFYFLLLFKKFRLSLKQETMPALIFLGLLVVYFYVTGAPGNIERYLLPAMMIEYLFLAYTITNKLRIFHE